MEAVMNSKPGAAHLFLENIYIILTNRTLPDLIGHECITSQDLVAHYALPTTNSVIRQMSGTPHKSQIIFEAHRKLAKSTNCYYNYRNEFRDWKNASVGNF